MNKYISQIQTLLKDAGFYVGTVDGIAGKLTVEAVEKAVSSNTVPVKEHSAVDSGFKFSSRSLEQLHGVNPKLIAVVTLALKKSTQDFSVNEGLRTKEQQEKAVQQGRSKTRNSKHLTGNAVDLVPFVNGKISWEWKYFYAIAEAMRAAAKELSVSIKWGGSWSILNTTTEPPEKLVADYVKKRKNSNLSAFLDGPHYELV